jgi:hypothetical protein
MALRHLCILDHEHTCVGIITRHDLLEQSIADRLVVNDGASGVGGSANPRMDDATEPSQGWTTPGKHTPFRRRLISRNSVEGTTQFKFAGFPSTNEAAIVEEAEDQAVDAGSGGGGAAAAAFGGGDGGPPSRLPSTSSTSF